jgi:hypothetical protein
MSSVTIDKKFGRRERFWRQGSYEFVIFVGGRRDGGGRIHNRPLGSYFNTMMLWLMMTMVMMAMLMLAAVN